MQKICPSFKHVEQKHETLSKYDETEKDIHLDIIIFLFILFICEVRKDDIQPQEGFICLDFFIYYQYILIFLQSYFRISGNIKCLSVVDAYPANRQKHHLHFLSRYGVHVETGSSSLIWQFE